MTYDFVGDPTGQPFLASFQCREVVLRLFPDAFVLAVAAAGQEVAQEVADDLAPGQVQVVRAMMAWLAAWSRATRMVR